MKLIGERTLKRSCLLKTSFCCFCGGQLNPGMKLYIGITSILNPHTHTSGQAFLLLPPSTSLFLFSLPTSLSRSYVSLICRDRCANFLIYCRDLFGLRVFVFHFVILGISPLAKKLSLLKMIMIRKTFIEMFFLRT